MSILRALMDFLILRLVLQKKFGSIYPSGFRKVQLWKFTEDNRPQVAAIPDMTITTFIGVVYLICVTQLDDSFRGEGSCTPQWRN